MRRLIGRLRPGARKRPPTRFRRQMTLLVWASLVLPVLAGSAVAAFFL